MDSEWAKNLAERKKLEAKRLQQEKDLNDQATYTATFSPQTWLLCAQEITYSLVVAEGNAVLWKDTQGKYIALRKGRSECRRSRVSLILQIALDAV